MQSYILEFKRRGKLSERGLIFYTCMQKPYSLKAS